MDHALEHEEEKNHVHVEQHHEEHHHEVSDERDN
jgi:hypothetical protein